MRSLLPWLLAVSAFGQESLSVEKEAALGAQVAADLRSRTVQINDQAVADYVQHITDRLAPHVESPFPWSVVVIQDTGEARAVEAVSIPGGYIFIPASLILKAGSEYDVAEVTAHAMAHIAQRFVWREPGKIPLIFIGGRGNLAVAAQLSTPMEAKATQDAARMLREAGYISMPREPDAALRTIQEKLKSR